jgi:hypothetical protein
MSTINRKFKTSYERAQEMVQLYAPLTQGSRLPSYQRPDITLQMAPSCHPAFAALMKSICARLDLTDRTQFSDEECRLFRYHRLNGLTKLYKKGLGGHALFAAQTSHNEQLLMLTYHMFILLGEKMLSMIGRDQYAQWFPWNDFRFDLDRSGTRFTLQCVSLAHHVTQDGRPFYYSANKHTVTLRGKTRIVAFSPHAMQRIAERTVASATSYADLGEVFGFVNHCQYFEPTTLHPHQDAFAFFNRCTKRHFSAQYAQQILQHVDPHTKYAYRVGYCPVVEEGNFFLAKTVLAPGYVGTPEYGALLKASFDKGVQEAMLARCTQQSYNTTVATQDFALLDWFHRHGVPQVIALPQPLFDYEVLTDHPHYNVGA